MVTDLSRLRSGLSQGGRMVSGFGESLSAGVSTPISGLAGLATTAGAGLVAFLSKGVAGASELNETMSKTEAIFGKSAGVIVAESKRMAQAFGTSQNDYLTAAGNFGAVFKGVGKSQAEAAALGNQLAKLGMDIASFDNVSNEEAFTAISSALRGEMDPIERFRVFLSADKVAAEALALGLAKSKKEIDETAKKMATMSLITKQTADAQGDLERTAGGAANQFRKSSGGLENFATSIGAVLLPAVQEATGLFNEFLATVVEAFEANKATFVGWAESLRGAMKTAGSLVRNYDLGWKIVKLTVADKVDDITDYVKTMGKNMVLVAEWIGGNWAKVLGNALVGGYNLIGKAFGGAGQLARKAFELGLTNVVLGPAQIGAKLGAAMAAGFKEQQGQALDAFPELLAAAGGGNRNAAEIARLWAEIKARDAGRAGAATPGAKKTPPGAAAAAAAAAVPAKFAGALEMGSKEAYSAILKATGTGRGEDGIKKVAASAEKQVAQGAKTVDLLQLIADRIGTAAGGAAAQLFSFT